jgi:hypothetical protein
MLALSIYFIPLWVAIGRGIRGTCWGVGLLNLCAGWTIIGWFGALIWACSAKGYEARQIEQDNIRNQKEMIEELKKLRSLS